MKLLIGSALVMLGLAPLAAPAFSQATHDGGIESRPVSAPVAAHLRIPPDLAIVGLRLIPPGACAVEDSLFQTADGGCKDLTTGIVWSAWTANVASPPSFPWEEAIAYCDNLIEDGYDDWFLPSKNQMLVVAANGSPAHFNWGPYDAPNSWWEWSSTRRGREAWIVNMSDPTGRPDTNLQGSKRSCFCVRIPTLPPITVTDISPGSMNAGETIGVMITGTDFAAGATLDFENGSGPAPSASGVTNVDPTTLTATVSVSGGGKPGTRVWDVRVTNTDGSTGVLASGFSVIK